MHIDHIKSTVLDLIRNSTDEDPVSSKELSAAIQSEESHDTCPSIRKVIRNLISEGYPIGSNGGGYFMIITQEQLLEYIENMQTRIDRITERVQAIGSGFKKMESKPVRNNICLPYKDRCKAFVDDISRTYNIPHKAVYTFAYAILSKRIGREVYDNCSTDSTLADLEILDLTRDLYGVLENIEDLLEGDII